MWLGSLRQFIVKHNLLKICSSRLSRQDQALELAAELKCFRFYINACLKFVLHYTQLIFNYLLNTRHNSNHYVAAINLSILAKSLEKKQVTINYNTSLVNSSSLTNRKQDSGNVWISDLSYRYHRFLQFFISNFFLFTVQLQFTLRRYIKPLKYISKLFKVHQKTLLHIIQFHLSSEQCLEINEVKRGLSEVKQKLTFFA